MPRTLSTALQAQVSAKATKTAFLVEMQLSTTIRLTDWYSPVTYNSEVYQAGGSFLSVDSITESGQLEVNEINIGFSNVTSEVRALVQDGSFTDKEVEIYVAYFNESDVIVGAISYFKGRIRAVIIDENITSSTINCTVASHWANWGLTKGRHFSEESQEGFSAGDKGMEFATQTKSDVRWGS